MFSFIPKIQVPISLFPRSSDDDDDGENDVYIKPQLFLRYY